MYELFYAIMFDMTTRKKFVLAVVWMSICIVSLVYVISPKKWVYLYYDSNYSVGEVWDINNDVLIMEEEVANIGAVMGNVMNFNNNTGWKFYSNNSGDTQVSLTYKSMIDDEEEMKEIWDIYIDDNMYVHHNMGWRYYFDVFSVYIIFGVISAGFGVVFLIAGIVDIIKSRRKERDNEDHQN